MSNAHAETAAKDYVTNDVRQGVHSGPGSWPHATVGVRAALPHLIKQLRVHTLVDLPCGDFVYMQHVLAAEVLRHHRLSYTGGALARLGARASLRLAVGRAALAPLHAA